MPCSELGGLQCRADLTGRSRTSFSGAGQLYLFRRLVAFITIVKGSPHDGTIELLEGSVIQKPLTVDLGIHDPLPEAFVQEFGSDASGRGGKQPLSLLRAGRSGIAEGA